MTRMRLATAALFVFLLSSGGTPASALAPVKMDCTDFFSTADAQHYLDADRSDPDRLDRDHDGLACEDWEKRFLGIDNAVWWLLTAAEVGATIIAFRLSNTETGRLSGITADRRMIRFWEEQLALPRDQRATASPNEKPPSGKRLRKRIAERRAEIRQAEKAAPPPIISRLIVHSATMVMIATLTVFCLVGALSSGSRSGVGDPADLGPDCSPPTIC